MRKGRAGRHRKRHQTRQQQQAPSDFDACVGLRKWMVLHSSRHDLADTLNLVPFHFPETGRGLKTKTVITPGSVIVSIPHHLLLTPSTVLDSLIGPLIKSWRTSFTPHQLLALFLVIERNRGSNSMWHPLISCFPTEYTLPHYFSHEELNTLPPCVSLVAKRMIQRSHQAHREVLQFFASHWEDADDWASWDSFRWAWCTVSSRSVFLEAEERAKKFLDLDTKEENNVALCPYLDLLNHTFTARVRAGMNWQNGHYELITDDAYQPHEQVFVSYGPHDNTTLFLNYGFTLPHNLHNSVCFSVDDFVKLKELFSVTCWEQKLTALRKHGLHQGLTCTMDGVSYNLKAALKILSMNWKQLQNSERAVTGETLPAAVEVSAQRMARHLVGEALAKSQALLAKQLLDKDTSVHCAIARSLVMDETSILTATLRNPQ